jgi:molybdopterin converting factor small subunit
MPTVTLKVTRWLCPNVPAESPHSPGIRLAIPDGESLRGLVRRLAAEQEGVWKTLFDEQAEEIGAHVLVVLNGCLATPHERSAAFLKDGDEVMFLPVFDGG